MMNCKPSSNGLFFIIFNSLFFLLCYFYFRFVIDPALIYQSQEPVFFFGFDFFKNFLSYSGGLTDYTAAFISQFYYIPWIGALLITLIFFLIGLSTLWLIKAKNSAKPVCFLHLIPVIFLVVLYSHYEHPLAQSIGLLLALLSAVAFRRFAVKQGLIKLVLFLFLSILLYYIAGGSVLLFATLCFFSELFSTGRSPLRFVMAFVYMGIAAALPYLAVNTLFMMTLKKAYTYPLLPEIVYYPPGAPFYLYLILLLIFVLKMFRRPGAAKPKKIVLPSAVSRLTAMPANALLVVQVLLFSALAVLCARMAYYRDHHTLLQMDYFSRNQKWSQVLETARRYPIDHFLYSYLVNRALFHTGQLPEEMFSYSQKRGVEGLFIPKTYRHLVTIQQSDVFYDLAHINESQHWAHETVSMRGETPWALKRLAVTYVLKKENDAAEKCLAMLNKTLFQKKWARSFERVLADSTLLNRDRQWQYIRSLMVKSDFVIMTTGPDPDFDLKMLLEANSHNRMAFEYLMAYYLLDGKVGKFIANITRLKDLNYPKIPRVYEEALILYIAETGNKKIDLPDYKLSVDTINRFNDFREIYKRHNNNKLVARPELASKYANTYWYYVMYDKPPSAEDADS